MDEYTVLDHLGNLGVVLLAALLSTCVHYLVLKQLNVGARLTDKFPQIRLVHGLIISLVARCTEIALLEMSCKVSITDHVFSSYAAPTTAGLGDILPTGSLRLLAGIEALTGFVLITWTAPYLYLVMTQM